MAKLVIRIGAAAVALGISLAGPQATATAEGHDDQGSPVTANPEAPGTGTARQTAGRPARGQIRSANTFEAPSPGTAGVPSAAATPDPRTDGATRPVGTASPPRDTGTRHRAERTAIRGEQTNTPPPAGALTGAATVSAVQSQPATPESVPTASVVVPSVAVPSVQATAGASEPTPVARAATVSAAAVAAGVTTTDVATNPFGPIQSFIEGVLLLVRRTFFNQAPTVKPVQITGQDTGEIAGTIGAVDPEGDPITYTVTSNPKFGDVQVNPYDGTYVYTPGTAFNGLDTFTVEAADSGLHINLFDPFRPAGTLANAVVHQGRAEWVQFDFSYPGFAFLWSPEARSALQTAATVLASYILIDEPVTVSYTVNGEFAPFSSQLASATSDMISSRPGFYPTVVQNKIISGVDVNASAADGTITWNFANPWSMNGSAASGQYDFQSVAMHELMHTFGFISTVVQPGSNTDNTWTTYDHLLVTADGTPVIGSDFIWNSAYDANLTGGDGGLYSGGSAAIAAYGKPVPLYTPNPWQAGSSVSHLSDIFVGRNKQLMIARVSTGTGIKTLSPIETGILTDLGYTTVTPSGASTVLMIGLFVLRRRRTDKEAG